MPPKPTARAPAKTRPMRQRNRDQMGLAPATLNGVRPSNGSSVAASGSYGVVSRGVPLRLGTAPAVGTSGEGFRVSGNAYLCTLASTAGSALQAFYPNNKSLTAANGSASILCDLNPNLATGPLGAQPALFAFCQYFSKYRYMTLGLEYSAVCPTSVAGAVIFGFVDDPIVDPATVTNLMLESSAGSIRGPVWTPTMRLQCPYAGKSADLCWVQELTVASGNTLTNVVSEMVERQTNRCSLLIAAQSIGSSVSYGTVTLTYTLDFYGLKSSLSVAPVAPPTLEIVLPPSSKDKEREAERTRFVAGPVHSDSSEHDFVRVASGPPPLTRQNGYFSVTPCVTPSGPSCR
jgi:hypothetical protein